MCVGGCDVFDGGYGFDVVAVAVCVCYGGGGMCVDLVGDDVVGLVATYVFDVSATGVGFVGSTVVEMSVVLGVCASAVEVTLILVCKPSTVGKLGSNSICDELVGVPVVCSLTGVVSVVYLVYPG